MRLTAVLMPDPDGGYVALHPETGTASQGETVEEALANLQEATDLYLGEFPIAGSSAPLGTTFDLVQSGLSPDEFLGAIP